MTSLLIVMLLGGSPAGFALAALGFPGLSPVRSGPAADAAPADPGKAGGGIRRGSARPGEAIDDLAPPIPAGPG
ncbi:hypothetical protein [Paracoccus contaminans]|nr:hypothetical protein [Paracoccus contaminans]